MRLARPRFRLSRSVGARQRECGTVEVPLDHDAPGVVMVERYVTDQLYRQGYADAERTTIVIDQRGVGSSVPGLECPELAELEVQESPAEEIDAQLDATEECRDRLAGEDRIAGSLLGMAAGDALGAGDEFADPPRGEVTMIGGGLGDFAPGEWTDDTSMALCIAEVTATGPGRLPGSAPRRRR